MDTRFSFFGSRKIPLLYFHFWLVLQQNAWTGIMNYESLLISAAYGKSVRTGKVSGHIETWTQLDSMQRMQLFMLASIYIVCTLYVLCTVNGPIQMQDACSTLIHIEWNMCLGPDARCVCTCDCSQTHTCLLRLCFLAPLPLLLNQFSDSIIYRMFFPLLKDRLVLLTCPYFVLQN